MVRLPQTSSLTDGPGLTISAQFSRMGAPFELHASPRGGDEDVGDEPMRGLELFDFANVQLQRQHLVDDSLCPPGAVVVPAAI